MQGAHSTLAPSLMHQRTHHVNILTAAWIVCSCRPLPAAALASGRLCGCRRSSRRRCVSRERVSRCAAARTRCPFRTAARRAVRLHMPSMSREAVACSLTLRSSSPDDRGVAGSRPEARQNRAAAHFFASCHMRTSTCGCRSEAQHVSLERDFHACCVRSASSFSVHCALDTPYFCIDFASRRFYVNILYTR